MINYTREKEFDLFIEINNILIIGEAKFLIDEGGQQWDRLIEAKHMKEGGGAQNKQIVEIIDFIKHQEDSDDLHYVTFMDGVYFNKFSKAHIQQNKIRRQKEDIVKNLEKNKNNFFVNTAGLKSLFKDIEGENKSYGLNKFLS